MKRSSVSVGNKRTIIYDYGCGSKKCQQRQRDLRDDHFKLDLDWPNFIFMCTTCAKFICQRNGKFSDAGTNSTNCIITTSNEFETGTTGSPARCKHILCLFLAFIVMMSVNAEIPRSSTSSNSNFTTASPGLVGSTPEIIHNNSSKLNTVGQKLKNPLTSEKRKGRITADKSKSKQSDIRPTSLSIAGTDTTKVIHPNLNLNQSSKSFESEPMIMPVNTHISKSKYFILQIFKRHSDENFLSIENFEKILKHIGLLNTTNISSINSQVHSLEEEDNHQNETHVLMESGRNEIKLASSGPIQPALKISNDSPLKSNKNNLTAGDSSSSHGKVNEKQVTKTEPTGKLLQSDHCLSQNELLQSFNFDKKKSLNTINFVQLCPALIDQLEGGYCKDHLNHEHGHSHDSHSDHTHEDHSGHEDPDHHHHHEHEDDTVNGSSYDQFEHPSTKVWLITFLSVTIICVCSIAGVLVIPNMNRVFYNHALQFLVALAVGAMSADAMLHLLPHALLSQSHHADHHHNPLPGNSTSKVLHPSGYMSAMYKGLVALMGIYMFFFLERLFTLFTNHRSKKRNMNNKKRRLQRIKEGKSPDKDHDKESHVIPCCDEVVMVVHPNKALKAFADVKHEALLHSCDESLTFSPSGHEVSNAAFNGNSNRLNVCASVSVYSDGLFSPREDRTDQFKASSMWSDAEIVGLTKERELEMKLENHAHSHMSRDFRGSVSSVAMMIVVGDMIHNFCDGLGIGTAFAGSIAGGLSTSVAVFCHELPHEIGDFAVLVRSGLSLKKALFYNIISSIPIFIGAIIGLLVGNLATTSLWVFAGVGGMFLYITLVDLVPEMTSVYTKIGEPWFLHLLLQASGIAVGTTIILIISVSEESLLKAFHN